MYNPINDGRWQPCPIGGCKETMSFEVANSCSLQLMEVAERMSKIQYGVAKYVNSSAERDFYNEQLQDIGSFSGNRWT